MKKILLFFALSISTVSFGQTHARVFLFVPGAFDGGWDYAKCDSILRSKGEIVYRPTLTGLGERSHLSSPDVDLSTFIADVVNVIKFENLHNVILIGHSFAGMVISGVAEKVPDRIKELVYLDAMVPNDDESGQTLATKGGLWDLMMKPNIKGGFVNPGYPAASNPPFDVPQSLKTFTEPLTISNPLVKKIPTAFIAMTKDGLSNEIIEKMGISRAKERNWKIYTLEGGHYSMRDQPENLVKKLEFILNESH